MNCVRNYMLILLFAGFILIKGQSFILHGQIGSFASAGSISANNAGFLFVADTDRNEISKIDTLGNLIATRGGFGWQAETFDYPADIYATTLNVYVADKNNHRVQIFDKDLNFLSVLDKSKNDSENKLNYPKGVALSNQGEIFVLDSDNSQILKYNLRGEFLFSFGGYESGSFALDNPTALAISESQNIFVISGEEIFIFDQFGNGIKKIQLSFQPTNISTAGDKIILTGGKGFFVADINENNFEQSYKFFKPDTDDEIKDAVIINQKIYVLTVRAVQIYKITNQ